MTNIKANFAAFFASGRSRYILAALAGVVLFVIVAIAVVKLAAPQAPPPNAAEQQAANFYAAVKRHDYATAYNLLADSQQAQLTQFAFTQLAKEQDTQNGVVTAYHELRYDRDANNANQGFVQEKVTRAKSGTYTIKLTVQMQPDGTWKIANEDRPI
jgi:hypothetical protein